MKTLKIFVLCAALGLPAMVSAQARGDRPGAQNPNHRGKRQWRQKMRQKRGKLLRQRLGLAEQQAVRVERVLDSYRAKTKPLRKEMRAAWRSVRQLLKSGSDDQRAYGEALKKIERARARVLTLHQAQRRELKPLLTPKQQIQLMVAHKRMRHRMMRRHMKRRGMRGQRGPGFQRGPRGRRHQGGGPAGPGQHPGYGPAHDGPAHDGPADLGAEDDA